MNLGKWGIQSPDQQRHFLALSLPSLNYASSLVCLGAILEAVKSCDEDDTSDDDLVDFYDRYSGKDCTFTLDRNGEVFECQGMIEGKEVLQEDDKRLKVLIRKTRRGSLYEFLDEVDLSTLRLVDSDLPIRPRKRRRNRISNSRFISALLDNRSKDLLHKNFDSGIAVMDIKKRFLANSEEEIFFGNSDEGAKGCLADIVNPNCLYKYRHSKITSFYCPTRKDGLVPDKEKPWELVILSGSRPVIRNFGTINSRCTVALLDRTERNNSSAEEHVLEQFYSRTNSVDIPAGFIPSSMNALAFTM